MRRFLMPIVLSAVAATSASAGIVSDYLIKIEIESGDGVKGAWELPYNALARDAVSDGQNSFVIDKPISIYASDGSEVLGTIAYAEVGFGDGSNQGGLNLLASGEQIVMLNFAVSTGDASVFTITSANVAFDEIANPQARASAAVAIGDIDGGGAASSGLLDGGKAYAAYYNDVANVPATGSTFASLIDGPTAGVYSANVELETSPAGDGYVPVGAPISSISSQWRFELGAGDTMTGTSVFAVVPEPATFSFFVIAGLFAAARRR